MFKVFFSESIVEFLVILALAFFSNPSMSMDNAQSAQERQSYKIRIISSELWHNGVELDKNIENERSVKEVLIPEALEISLRNLDN